MPAAAMALLATCMVGPSVLAGDLDLLHAERPFVKDSAGRVVILRGMVTITPVAGRDDLVLTGLFDIGWPDAPHRVLRNKAVAEWEAAGRPASGNRPGEGAIIGRVAIGGHPIDVIRHSVVAPLPGFEGDVEYACLYAGESCTLVNDIRPAAEIVHDVLREAEEILVGRRKAGHAL